MYMKVILKVYFFKKKFLATPCGRWDPSSLTRDPTHAPCIGSTESQPLDPQGNKSSI